MDRSPHRPDFAVREIEASKPRIRDDLRCTFQEIGGEGGYLLEDPLNGRFFRLGPREHRFAISLDGRRAISEIIAELASSRDEAALDSGQAASLVRMLTDAGLVVTKDSEHAGRVFDEVNRPTENRQIPSRMGQILFLRIPLGNPDRFFRFLARQFGWLAGLPFFLLWLATVVWGGYSVHRQWERFGDEMSGLFDFGNLWIVGLLWIGLKAFHECWHGLVCRYFGGAVPEAGVTLLLLTTPLGYVNASSSAGFHSKWQRIAVAGAGIYGELFLAAVAAVVWSRVEPGAFGAALHQVVVLSSFTTLLFNANPLMRFDGYYIFSDLLDIPNLYSKGQASSRWLFRRWVLGIPQAKSPLRPTDKKLIIGLYGVAAAFWRVLVVVGLLAAAALLFEGAGLVLALVAGAGMAIQGLGGMVHYLRKSASAEGMRPSRLLLRATALAALLVGVLCLIRVTPSARAPAVIQNAGGGEIRSQCPGFLSEIAVANGQAVEKGELLARLENVEEEARLRKLEAEIARSQLKADQHLNADRLAAWQAETEHLEVLQKNRARLAGYVSTLEIRAPRDGIVLSRRLDSLEGTWIAPGEFLLSIGSSDEKELVALASQEDWDRFEAARADGRALVFRLRGRWRSLTANLDETAARATVEPVHFALITAGGGPIPVKQRTAAAAPSEHPSNDSNVAARFELTQPHFEIRARLEAGRFQDLHDGETGVAIALASEPESLARLAWRKLRSGMDRLIQNRTHS